MSLQTTFAVLSLALLIDALIGYPDELFRAVGHPVTWIGRLITELDQRLNRPEWSEAVRRLMGCLALAALVAVSYAIAFIVQAALSKTALGAFLLALVASAFLASRSLYDHVREVQSALTSGGVEAGRIAVAKIVGRDPETLDEPAISRAAIESLAENASDGIVAPVFWFLILGFPGLVAYKAINTADSMIGHKNERYGAFGWASARLDDLVNLPASRITGGLFALAAKFAPNASSDDALAAMRRDAHLHRSPNAGWPESAMAGALGLKLNGPRSYGGVQSTDAYMGHGRLEATPHDIGRALHLSCIAWAMMTGFLFLAALILRA